MSSQLETGDSSLTQTQLSDPTPSESGELSPTLRLLRSLHQVRTRLGSLTRDKMNPFTKSQYTTINAIYQQLLPVMAEHQLYLTSRAANGQVTTTIHHENGASLSSSFRLPDTDDIQKIGGAMTYGTRYNIVAMMALPQEDDDGHTASQPSKAKRTTPDDYQPF